jgi:nucleoside-diphosphate-sugar epimerase
MRRTSYAALARRAANSSVSTIAPTPASTLRLFGPWHVNVGSGEGIAILDLTRFVCGVVGFGGRIVHDLSKPDGTPQKLMSADRLRGLGWVPRIALAESVRRTYDWFASRTGVEAV